MKKEVTVKGFCRFAALAALILAGGCSDRAEDGQAEVTPLLFGFVTSGGGF